MVEKDNSHPLPACVGNLTFHSELNCHPLSCAAANYKHITNCSVQHNPSVMDLINPSSAPIPPWTAFLCRKRTIPQTIINPSDAWGAKCFLCHPQHKAAASCSTGRVGRGSSMGTTLSTEATPASGAPGMRIQEEMRVPQWHKTFYHRRRYGEGEKRAHFPFWRVSASFIVL